MTKDVLIQIMAQHQLEEQSVTLLVKTCKSNSLESREEMYSESLFVNCTFRQYCQMHPWGWGDLFASPEDATKLLFGFHEYVSKAHRTGFFLNPGHP
jgi:hypothetical protein